MSKDKLIPELQFPEFKSEGEWRTDLLGNLVEIKGRIGYRGYTREDIVEEGKGAITLSPSNFEESGSLNFEKCTYITWEKYEESPEIKLEEGQTVLVKTASVGKSAYVGELPAKATINPQIVILKPQKIESKFLAYSIFHNYVQIQIKGAVGAGAIPNMSQDSISKFDILLPPDKKGTEQQKIASCLSSLDELIAAHYDKLDTLKDHKKGLMQNIFPQEGETVPKVRFSEFEGDGDWVENDLNDFCFNISSGKDKNQDNGEYDLYGSTGIIAKTKFPSYEGDYILVARVGANAGLLNRAIGQFGVTDNTLVVNLKEPEKIDFIFYSLAKIGLNKLVFGSGQPLVTGKQLKELIVPTPKNPKEQQKIASCLSAVDELITAQAEKIEQLQQHKKGLMQGLFP